jgi:hypothetical protein
MAYKKFAITGTHTSANVTAATAGIIKLEGTAATRAFLYEWDINSAAAAAPVDQNYLVRLKRQTTAGTWTAATPAALDTADPAAVSVGGVNSTAAGTASTILAQFGFNARAGFRWVAVPDSEFVVPATAANGIILEYVAVSGGTDNNSATFLFQE